MHLNPAQYVIFVLGGTRQTAKAIGRSVAAVSKWNKPRAERGCDGRLPSSVQRRILDLADVFKLDITSEDLIRGRRVSDSHRLQANVPLKNGSQSKNGGEGEAEKMNTPSGKIDTEWFVTKIQDRHESLRKFSKLMIGRNGKPLDVSALSLMFRDERKMQIYEAKQISKFLNEPIVEILRRVEMDQDMCEGK